MCSQQAMNDIRVTSTELCSPTEINAKRRLIISLGAAAMLIHGYEMTEPDISVTVPLIVS